MDPAVDRVTDADYQEARNKLEQEIHNRFKILSKAKQREYLSLYACLEEHLDEHCPEPYVPSLPTSSSEKEEAKDELAILSTPLTYSNVHTPLSSPTKVEADFSPLRTGLKRGLDRGPDGWRSTTEYGEDRMIQPPALQEKRLAAVVFAKQRHIESVTR